MAHTTLANFRMEATSRFRTVLSPILPEDDLNDILNKFDELTRSCGLENHEFYRFFF
jgi:hypothetical protein